MVSTKDELITALRAAHADTFAAVADLPDAALEVTKLDIVNPFLWEMGHVAFFYDALVLGHLDGTSPLLDGAARIYDSFKVDHDDRWDLPLPDRETTVDYMRRVFAAIEQAAEVERDRYCFELALLHEYMHTEAFAWMRQTLEYDRPAIETRSQDASGAWPGDVEVPGGVFQLGADPETEHFVFDNEKWAHPVEVASFKIAKAPVTNTEFLAFVEDGGYEREALWSHQGWVWRGKNEATAPVYWHCGIDGWLERHFEQPRALAPNHPVLHVGWFEAEAFCNWAGRRLPTEAEWEMAASLDPETGGKRRYPWGDELPDDLTEFANLDGLDRVDVAACAEGDSAVGCRQMLGNVWEWTADPFYPFPGYVVDTPYREYSAPWFGYRKVLKGGAAVTRSRLAHNVYRNFFTPDRRDVFAGFRTCAR